MIYESLPRCYPEAVTRTAAAQATIQDVAALAGVSRAAVSKVIRDAYGVSPAMRERVNAAIEQLGYRPRVGARALRGATHTIGFELPALTNPFFAKILTGATEVVEDTAYQLIVAPTPPGKSERRPIDALLDRQVDGLVAISPEVEQEWLERLAPATPIVMIGRHDDSPLYDTVTGDDEGGAELLLRHLIDLGHRRIGHITIATARPGDTSPHGRRLGVYERIAAELGTTPLVARSGQGADDAYDAARRLLAADQPPTAIFAGNDTLALEAQRALADAGARDVSVAGYDDVDIAGHPGIDLTTIDQDGVGMGRTAVRLLLERIAGRDQPVHAVSPAALRVRGSTRAPAV
ncbi:LacI family DNA-binding transcriptional regulator [Microbacterium gilvum]|uniref:LacI family DNA-binding transcriptional regulator n=1 Tax=Microbacterium gilvum TaxID=1336204 RepID=A0ABP9AAV9_9MICO